MIIKSQKKFSAKLWIFSGVLTLVVLIVAFGGWSITTNISGAIVTSGVIQGTSKTIVIQDTQGGKISTIYVSEGQEVRKNQKLIDFNADELETEYSIVRDQLVELLAKRARLEAELSQLESIDFTELELIATHKIVEKQKNAQSQIFISKKEIIEKQVEQLNQRIVQIESLIKGLNEQKVFLTNEIRIVEELLLDKENLLQRQLIQNASVIELRRDINQLQSRSASLSAEISKNAAEKNEVGLEIIKLRAQNQENALTEIRDQQFREMELKERFAQLKTKITERTLYSPIDGEVFELNFLNSGAVVRPAEKIMGIVPADSKYVIEAKISPLDVDETFTGQGVRISFPSLPREQELYLYSKILGISADTYEDERNGQSYYKAIIDLPNTEINKLPSYFQIRPGMIAETYILKRDRSVAFYLTQPFTRFFDKAFRE